MYKKLPKNDVEASKCPTVRHFFRQRCGLLCRKDWNFRLGSRNRWYPWSGIEQSEKKRKSGQL